MIKLFRNTRSKLLTQNRIGRYLMYAFGEIILVVIGILIALKINNWNQNLKNIKLANDYLENVSNDLKYDTLVFGSALKNLKQLEDVKAWGLQIDSYNDVPWDYLDAITTSQYFNMKVNNNSFTQMNNIDVLKLSHYKNIFKALNFYYTQKKDYLDNFNEWELQSAQRETRFWYEQGDFEINFWEIDSIPIQQSPEKRKMGLVKRLNSNMGRNMVKMSLLRVQTIQQMYSDQKKLATRLLTKIDSLQNHDQNTKTTLKAK